MRSEEFIGLFHANLGLDILEALSAGFFEHVRQAPGAQAQEGRRARQAQVLGAVASQAVQQVVDALSPSQFDEMAGDDHVDEGGKDDQYVRQLLSGSQRNIDEGGGESVVALRFFPSPQF